MLTVVHVYNNKEMGTGTTIPSHKGPDYELKQRHNPLSWFWVLAYKT